MHGRERKRTDLVAEEHSKAGVAKRNREKKGVSALNLLAICEYFKKVFFA